jgi:thiol-disulfide isomerase/thioredoxin
MRETMRRIFLFAIAPLILLACNFLLPVNQRDENPIPASPEVVTAQPILSTPQTLTSPTESFVIVRINKTNGGLMTQLASEAEKASALGLAPFIEFDATWCPPCQAIDKSIQAKDPLTMQALEGVYLIRADVDEWGSENGKNFTFDAIPVYYQLDASGNPTGAMVDGGAWNEDIPENFAPVLDAFFHSK